ncbi:MAG TPA: FHA domain-containing protein [Pirellulales bacterium]|nr:FHA domain-containing protein [Pirellulales bacterium]
MRGPDGSQREFSLRKPFALIGGDPRADVVLNEGSPPPCGLYLHATNDGIFCVGLSPSAPHGWLRPKKYVKFAEYKIAAQFDDDGPPQVTSTVDPRAKNGVTGLAPRLEFRSTSGKALERTVSRQITVIGREPPSTLRLKHDSISRAHLVLYWDGATLWFVDLLSRNGAQLDGQPREAGKLLPGQTLHLGRVRVRQIGVADPAEMEPSQSDALAKSALVAAHAARESAGAIRERVLRDQVATMQDTIERLRRELQEHQRLATAEQERLRQEPMAQQIQFDQRLTDIEAPLAAELAALRQELDQRQTELDRSRAQAEEQAEQIRELEARQEPEVARLRQELDRRQDELDRSRTQAEEQAEQIRELEARREPEVARLRQELQEHQRLATAEQVRLRQESMAQQTQFDQRLTDIEAPLAAELAALRQELDRRQDELDRSRRQAEEQAEQIRELAARREPEVVRLRQELLEQQRLAAEERERLCQESTARQAQFDQRLTEIEAPLAEELAALQQELDQRQAELERSRTQAEEQTEVLRQEINRRESELLAERDRAVQLSARLDEIETRRAADVEIYPEPLDEISAPEPQGPLPDPSPLTPHPSVGRVVSGRVVGGGTDPHPSALPPPDPSPLTPHPSPISPQGAGPWDDQVLNRLLEFKAKRDNATSWRRWFVAAGVAGLVLAVAAGVLVLAKVWLSSGPG